MFLERPEVLKQKILLQKCIHYILLDATLPFMGSIEKISISSNDSNIKEILGNLKLNNLASYAEIEVIGGLYYYQGDKRKPVLAIALTPIDTNNKNVLAIEMHFSKGIAGAPSGSFGYYFDLNGKFLRREVLRSH